MKKALLLIVLSLWANFAFVQSQNSFDELFSKNGEIYFKFEISTPKVLPDITRIISIDNREGNTIFAYANKNEFEEFLLRGYNYQILPHPNEGFDPPMASFEQINNSDTWDFYPTYDAYVALMYQFEADYPDICDVFSIGQLSSGRELLVAKISDNVGTDEAEPEFLYTSSMHGDELTGYPLMLNLIDSLLSNYGSVARITNLVNNIEIYINPLANPDGTYHGGNSTVSGATRYNGNSVDLNRNYPDPKGGPHPDGHVWQDETVAFMNFAENRHFVMSANFHGGTEVCNYPWDTWSNLTADDNWWQYVCHEYADTCQAYSPSNYMNDYYDGITNGYDWYSIEGGRQDYMNYFHQCREVTLEISDTKLIPASQLDAHWEYNRRSFLNYMEQVLFGISGLVTDAVTGQPVEAEVYILNHEEDSSWVYSSMPAGNYHRLVNAGTYDVQFSAPCYQTQVIQNITVQNKISTTVNVQLQPNAVDFTANETTPSIGESVFFTDLSCEPPLSWLWTITGSGTPVFVEGTSNTSQNPIIQFDMTGLYSVSLTITTATGNFTETKPNYINVIDCTYCPSTYSNTTDDWITNITFNTINNNSGQGGSDSYEDFTDISTEVEAGMSYPVSVTFEMNGDWHEDCFAFIDWNQDCDFDDPGETYDLGYQVNSGTLTSSISVPADVLPGVKMMRIVEQYNQNPGPCDSHPTVYGETEDYTLIVPSGIIELDLKVFLEGPFNGTDMNTDLNSSGLIPLSQPFNTSPWDYNGTENVSSIPNTDIVDWILIELRDATDASSASSETMIAMQAAFLLNDGSVVGLDGNGVCSVAASITNNLFVVVYHHNHLDIMSAYPLTKSGGVYSYDFTTSAGQAYNAGQKNIGGIYLMYGGDANADGEINDLDKSESWLTETGLSGYLPSDLDLDGQSNNIDKNDVWLLNIGINSHVPE